MFVSFVIPCLLFVPAGPCAVPNPDSTHSSAICKKDKGLEGESLCGTSAWLNAHRSECNGLLLLHFARDLWVWLEMSGRVLKRSNIEGEKLPLVPVLSSSTLVSLSKTIGAWTVYVCFYASFQSFGLVRDCSVKEVSPRLNLLAQNY